jgi:hypothetical protein
LKLKPPCLKTKTESTLAGYCVLKKCYPPCRRGTPPISRLSAKQGRNTWLGGSKGEHTLNTRIRVTAGGLLTVLFVLLLTACAWPSQPGGTAWGSGAFDSNGERIYFTATSERGIQITYTGGPAAGMMMGGGDLTCASCHGPDGQGGIHTMHMETMEALDIRWAVLQDEFDVEKFRLAVVEGQDPDGTQLDSDMPRWDIGDDDLADLIAFLKTLP